MGKRHVEAKRVMSSSKKRALVLGVPIIAGATLASASPARAAGPTETKSITSTHVDGLGHNVTCTVTLRGITNYQNQPKRDFASYDVTNTGGCRDAQLDQYLTWVTDKGGNAGVTELFHGTSLVPAHSENAYQPVNPNAGTAQFTQRVYMTFDNCVSNCTIDISKTLIGGK